jgi:hypothetical protein
MMEKSFCLGLTPGSEGEHPCPSVVPPLLEGGLGGVDSAEPCATPTQGGGVDSAEPCATPTQGGGVAGPAHTKSLFR